MPQKNKQSTDNVNHPTHYNSHPSGLECIIFKRHMTASLSDAFKYVWRYSLKGGVEDLEKSMFYIKDDRDNRVARVEDHIQPEQISQLIMYEPNILVAHIFKELLRLSCSDNYEHCYDLLIDTVKSLIKEQLTDQVELIKPIPKLNPNIDHFDV